MLVEMLELVHRDQHSLALPRCPRVAAALASKACRSAIMIGAPLSAPQMCSVVRNLAGLRKPWICAHGRPTVRLLYTS